MTKTTKTGWRNKVRRAGRYARTAGIIVVLAVTVSAQFTQTGYALFGKQRLIYEDNVLYFDYKVPVIAAACGAAGASSGCTNLQGRDNREKAFNFFIGKGLSPAQSAGIVGNLEAESGVDPTKKQIPRRPGGPSFGHGIAQWETRIGNQGSGRWDVLPPQNGKIRNVKDFAASPAGQGRAMTDLCLQLDFLWHELENFYAGVLAEINAAPTHGLASFIFMAKFEAPADRAPGGANARNRAERAGKVLADFGDTQNGGDAQPVGPVTDACGPAGGSVSCDAGGAPVTGRAAILCEARKFDPFGYLWGGGHGGKAEVWMAQFMASGGYQQPFKRVLDCTGLVRMALWNVYKVDVDFTTSIMASVREFKEIQISETQPGDFVWRPGHVEVVAANGAAETFGARTQFAPEPRQITGGGKQNWSKAYRYVGPGAQP